MKILYTIISILIAAALLASCSDTDVIGGGRGGDSMELGLTINAGFGAPTSFADADGHVTRTVLSDDNASVATRSGLPGDPGTTEEFPAPANIYLFTFLRLPGANTDAYYFNYEQIENLSADDWTIENATAVAYASTRYRLKQSIAINVAGNVVANYPKNTDLGRTYAIATPKDKRIAKTIGEGGLFTQWFKDITHLGLSTATGTSVTVSNGSVTQIDYDNFVKVLSSTAVIDCGDGSHSWLKQDGNAATQWTSDDYRDLYSTPMETVDNADNGTFVWDGTTLHQNDIRLYHAAAKYDFQWEVAEKDADGKALRSQLDGVYLRKVTLTNVPTRCAIFDPTDLPSSDAEKTAPCVVAKNTSVNKYRSSTITYSSTGTYSWNDAAKSNLPNYHSPVEQFTTDVTPVEWEGVDTTRRDQIFLGRSYAYAFLPSRVNAQTTVNYNVEVCSSTATTDYSSESKRPVQGTDLAEDQVQVKDLETINPGSEEARLAKDHNIDNAASYRLCEFNDPFEWTKLTMKPSYKIADVTVGDATVKALNYDVMRTETYSCTHHRHYFFYNEQNAYLGEATIDERPVVDAVFPSGVNPTGAGDIHCVLTPVTLPSKSVTFAPHDAFTPWVRVRAMINSKPKN